MAQWLPGAIGIGWQILAAGLIFSVVLTGRGSRPLAPELWIVVGVLTLSAAVLTMGTAVNPRAHWVVAAQILIYAAFGPFAVAGLIRVSGLGLLAVDGFLLGQTISAVAAALQATGHLVFGVSQVYGRSAGLAGHPNILALFSSIAVLLVFDRLRQGRHRNLLAAAGAMSLVGLLASGSLSALAALAGGLVVYFAAARLRLLALIGVSVVGYAAFEASLAAAERYPTFRGPFDRLLQLRDADSATTSTVDIREKTWRFAWEHIQRDWTGGVGLDDASGATFDALSLTHNVLLRAWFQGGPLLGLAYLLVLGLSVFLVASAVRRGRAAAPAAVLVVTWVFALTAATFQQGYLWGPLLASAVATGRLLHDTDRSDETAPTLGRTRGSSDVLQLADPWRRSHGAKRH